MKILIVFIMSINFAWANFPSNEFAHWYYKTKSKYQNWKYIVLHHSAGNSGNITAFDKMHTDKGYGGVAYHFVIGNGNGMKDGEVAETFRWKKQMAGTHVTVDSWEYNVFGIGICLVGNLENKQMTKKQKLALTKLIKNLQEKYSIPASRVMTHKDVPYDDNKKKKQATLCAGKNLKINEFKFHVD